VFAKSSLFRCERPVRFGDDLSGLIVHKMFTRHSQRPRIKKEEFLSSPPIRKMIGTYRKKPGVDAGPFVVNVYDDLNDLKLREGR
jgi:hypothetical protein